MQKERANPSIIAVILEGCLENTGMNEIIDASGMNFDSIEPYMASLMRSGLIEMVDMPTYKTTEKGLEALKHIKVLQDFITNYG